MECSVLSVFWILGACRDGTFGFPCHDYLRYCNEQDFLVHLATELCQGVNEIGFPWFLKESSLDTVHSVSAITRSAEVNWTRFTQLDVYFPYLCETCNVFHLGKGRITLPRKRQPHSNIPLTRRTSPARAFLFAVDRLL